MSAATKWFNFSSGWPSIWGNKTTSNSNSTPTQHTKSKQKEKNAPQEKTSQEAKSSSWSWPSMWGKQTASKSDYTSIQHTKSKQKEKSSPQEKIKEKPKSRITLIRDWLRKWRDRNVIFGNEKISKATQAALEDIRNSDVPAVYDAKGKPTYKARCNKGVKKAYKRLAGNKDLSKKRANQMIAYMAQSPHWEKATSMEQAHQLANEGYFVVAGWKNPDSNESGHVAVVVPGDMVKSDWWDCFVPLTLDTGARARQAAGLLSQGFGKNKRSEIEFYVYKGPINKK